MYARFTNVQVVVDKIDEGLSIWRDKAGPGLKQAKGFKGAYVTGDRETGKSVVCVLWETKEDADAALAMQSQLIALFGDVLAGPPTVETYEVMLQF